MFVNARVTMHSTTPLPGSFCKKMPLTGFLTCFLFVAFPFCRTVAVVTQVYEAYSCGYSS